MLADAAARAHLLEDLDSTFVVEAAAGTGKTTVLVARIVAVVRAGKATLDQIISVTFTEKAAGEMKLRLREALERAREEAIGVEAARLRQALQHLEVARIGTIHGLCADLLREYPVEAQVDPLFEVAAEDGAESLFDTAFTHWFERVLSDPPEGVRRLLRRTPRGSAEDPPRVKLLQAAFQLSDHRDFQTAWRRPPFDRHKVIDEVLTSLEAVAATVAKLTQPDEKQAFVKSLREIDRFVDDVRHRERVRERDYDGLEASLRELSFDYNWSKQPYRLGFNGLTVQQVVTLRAQAYDALKSMIAQSEGDLAACLQTELRPVLDAYELEKARSGTLDFVDLLLKTRELLRDHTSVRQSLQRRFTKLFVDEFQDTDPLQTEILLLLAATDVSTDEAFAATPVPGKLFVVGDPKQSIYRFRRADITLYERVKQHLISHGARVEYLQTSFRSTPGIQLAVNEAFSRAMTPNVVGQAQYVRLEPFRAKHVTQPSVIALSVPRPFSPWGTVQKSAVEASTPNAVCAFIEFLLTKSGWTVDEDGERGAVQARHVCILFKRFRGWNGEDIPRAYARELEARHIAHVLVGGRSFHARDEILALRTAMRAIEWPDDELSVFATLRGPFMAVGDEALLLYKNEFKRLRAPKKGAEVSHALKPVVEGLALLRALHFARAKQSVSRTLQQFLEATRAVAGVAFWTAGDQALANVLQFVDRAKRLETRATSFRQVIELFEAEADSGGSREAPIVEEGTDGVRMMTVHGAKGLEFPVVILAEPTANAARKRPSHWVDPERRVWAQSLADCEPWDLRDHETEVLELDRHESLRLAYVAATRARDLLVVPAVGDDSLRDTWTEPLYPAIYPAPGTAGAPRKAPGCPDFGFDCVLDRQGPMPENAPRPGLHVATTRTHGVVWWDPATLPLVVGESGGLQSEDALKNSGAAQESLEAFGAWSTARATVASTASVPALTVLTARSLDAGDSDDAVPIAEARTDATREGRPRGRRFGELVHGVLARVAFDVTRPALTAQVERLARTLLSSSDEQRWAVEAAWSALHHPLLAVAAKADEVRREAPMTHLRADGVLIEGVVDLAFRSGETWQVVEFKTDDTLERHRDEYVAQTRAYVAAISAATGLKAHGTLLLV